MNPVILHIDMNSYFASVEQQANPFFRGKPLGVCAYLSDNGCIIASSMEAKKIGITTGTRVREAKKIYPKILLVENEPSKYRSVTERIFSILADYTNAIEPYSIDEAFLDLTGWTGRAKKDALEDAYRIAVEIKNRITKEVGEWLKCSIGIAPTRWLAKFASDTAEKDSILILKKGGLEAAYKKSRLTDAWGINNKIAWRLNRLGIYTLNDLKQYPPANIFQAMGKPGYFLWAHVNGIEVGEIKSGKKEAPKSIGHSYCLARQSSDLKYLRAVLMKLCEKTGRRLRKNALEARTISAYAGYVDGYSRHKSTQAPCGLFDTPSIFHEADNILFSDPPKNRARMLAVSVSGLLPINKQLSFFSDKEKKRRLAVSLDNINDTFGEFSAIYGEMFGTTNAAKDRVGFRKTLETPEIGISAEKNSLQYDETTFFQ